MGKYTGKAARQAPAEVATTGAGRGGDALAAPEVAPRRRDVTGHRRGGGDTRARVARDDSTETCNRLVACTRTTADGPGTPGCCLEAVCSLSLATSGFSATSGLCWALPMTANTALTENEMVEATIAWLRDRLPESWEIGPTSRQMPAPGGGRVDAAIDVKGSNGTYATIAVEVKKNFGPRGVDQLLGSLGRTLRNLAGNVPILVVAPWLSDRTRERLRDEGINYLDLTGNAFFRLENPTVFIETQGARKDPSPLARGKARLQGPKAGRLVRTLVDVRPPYGVRELATAAELTPGYVSRLLDTLDDEALVQRSARGGVESVDIGGLIRRWADSYDVFRANEAVTYLAAAGASQTLQRLASTRERTAVTGSFAAVRLAAVAGPALLTVYCNDPTALAAELELMPTDQGANVAILSPFDPVVWERTSVKDGVTFAAPSQVAIDCLTGNGRMPAEGEALVQWMTDNENAWRLPVLSTVAKKASS